MWIKPPTDAKPAAAGDGNKDTKTVKRGCGVIIGIIIGLWIVGKFVPSNSQQDASSAPPPSINEWTAKADKLSNGQLLRYGTVYLQEVPLVQAVGQPSNVTETDNNVFLDWACSDGTIEIKADKTAWRQGVLVGSFRRF